MTETQTFTYFSPLTGVSYLIVPKTETRMVGDWHKGEPLKPVEVTTYEVMLNGNRVQFALSEAGVAKAVAHYEGVNDGWYCLPRD